MLSPAVQGDLQSSLPMPLLEPRIDNLPGISPVLLPFPPVLAGDGDVATVAVSRDRMDDAEAEVETRESSEYPQT